MLMLTNRVYRQYLVQYLHEIVTPVASACDYDGRYPWER